MNENDRNLRKRFEEVLDTFGADSARWPRGERARLERLVATDPAAARMFEETRAFDRLLDLAPGGDVPAGLADRIVAAAVGEGGRAAQVVPLSAMRAARDAGRASPPGRAVMAPAAALLAASFAFGIYLGAAVVDDTRFGREFATAAFEGSGGELEGLFALPDEVDDEPGGLL